MSTNEVEFVGKVKRCGDLFEIIGPAGLMIFRDVDERYLHNHCYPVPERTTAVTVHLTDEECDAWVAKWPYGSSLGSQPYFDGMLKVAEAIRAQREADQ